MADIILEVKNISKKFGGTQALKEVSFSVEKGEIHALVGSNGSGKSTLIKSLMGAIKIDDGNFNYKGEKIKLTDPLHAQRMGIGAIYQEPTLIPYFDAAQNIFLGHEICKNKLGHVDRKKLEENAYSVIEKFDIDFPLNIPVSRLGLGQQRVIEVAKVLSQNSELILVDEATAGMHEEEITKFFSIMRQLKNSGITIIYVSHYLDNIFKIADRVSVLRDGEYICTDIISEIDVEEIIPKMLGRTLSKTLYPEEKTEKGKCMYAVEGLSHGNLINNISFKIYEGEILGITGLMGAGKTEIARTLYGIDCKKSTGTLKIGENKTINLSNCGINKKHGIIYLPEERKVQSVFLKVAINTNIFIGNMNLLVKGFIGHLSQKKANQFTNEVIESMGVKVESVNQTMNQLSGGNQQKIVLGKWIASEPNLLLLDEPTRGIDIGAKAEIYRKIKDIVNKKKAVILFSSEIDELVGMCDRLLIIHKGNIYKELEKCKINKDEILLFSMGRSHE